MTPEIAVSMPTMQPAQVAVKMDYERSVRSQNNETISLFARRQSPLTMARSLTPGATRVVQLVGRTSRGVVHAGNTPLLKRNWQKH